MIKCLIVIPILLLAANCFGSDLPDPTLTPGAINPDLTQANIHSTVCVKGWTKTVRPPAYYTNKLKKLQMTERPAKRILSAHHLIPNALGTTFSTSALTLRVPYA